MATTPNIGLTTTALTDTTKTFRTFRNELAGTASTSNMMIIDTEVGALKTWKSGLNQSPLTWGMLKYGLGWTSS